MAWDHGSLECGPVPLWHQIAERLRAAIDRGEFRPGDALPSESELNRRFGISRTTARASLDRLKEDGLISRRSGKGSIVLPRRAGQPRVEQSLDRLAGFAEDMRSRGLQPSYVTESVRRQSLTRQAAEALELPHGQACVRIKRRLLADGYPIGLSDSWLSASLTGKRDLPVRRMLDQGSLYEWLREVCHAPIAGGQEHISALAASASQARALDVEPGDPLLVATRVCRSPGGLPIEYATVHYRADRYCFRIDLVNP